MSRFLTASAIVQFDDMVKHAYQTEEALMRPTVRVKTGVVGTSHQFPTMGKGMAMPRIPQSDVIPMGITHARKVATLSDWNAPEYTDIFDQATNNVNEQKELASVIAAAINRREDQLILDAMDAASTSLVVSENVGGNNTNLNTAKARLAKARLDTKGVSKKDRYAAVHSNNIYGLLGDSDANTFDKNAVKALVDGEITKWLGFTFVQFDDRDEGGLPIAASVRVTYFYHGGMRGAVGLAVGLDKRTEVNYIPEKTSWLANGLFKAGSVGVDAEGIVEVSCNETGI
jgi:hypothetical protein